MEKEEKEVNNDLKKLIKKANQRILRLERLTGEKETFATKQLYDYLSIPTIQAITKTGRIGYRIGYTKMQKMAIEKAVNQFLSSASTATAIKKYQKTQEAKYGKPLSFEHLDILYQAQINYGWIYAYIPSSEFWGDWVPRAKEENWTQSQWVKRLKTRISDTLDEELKAKLQALYNYVMGE